MPILYPKVIEVECPDGATRKYTISKFPAVTGREIVTQYPLSAIPKLGDYGRNEELMFKLMAFVAVSLPTAEGAPRDLLLTSKDLVNNHVPDFETLMKIEMAMMEYNCSFFARGKASNFFETLAVKAQAFLTQTLTDFSVRFSKKD